MTLNLAQTRSLVQSAQLTPNVSNPAGEAIAMSALYRELKSLGWQSTGKTHPVDKTSLLTLGSATIRRNPNAAPGHWIVDVCGGETEATGSLEAITAYVVNLVSEDTEEATEIAPVSPAKSVAQSLIAEYPALAPRIVKALQLVEALDFNPAQYNTRWDNAGRFGCWSCDCPDAQHRNPRTRYGVACKHALAGTIQQIVKQEAQAVTMREVASKAEARRAAAIPFMGEPGTIDEWIDDYAIEPAF